MGSVGSELSSGVHLEEAERGGKEPSKKQWPEGWMGTREFRGRGVLRKRVWPVVHNVAEDRSEVSTQGLMGGNPGRRTGWGGGLALCPWLGMLPPGKQ